uniref:Uncharacterized protein n=1 Tax=viral metagenome TaxID=1070528 RepID=A0A6C0HAA6_9ZZZZ
MVDNKILIPSVIGGVVFLIIFGLGTKEYWNYRKKENRRIENINKWKTRRIDKISKMRKEERIRQKEIKKEIKKEEDEVKKQEELDIIFGKNPEFYPEEYYEDDGIGKGIVKKSNKITKKNRKN